MTERWKPWKTKTRFPTFSTRDPRLRKRLAGSKTKTLWTRGKPPVQSEDAAKTAVFRTAERIPAVPADFRIIIRLENASGPVISCYL